MKVFIAVCFDVNNRANVRAFFDRVVAMNSARTYVREQLKCPDNMQESVEGDRWVVICEGEPANAFVIELEVDQGDATPYPAEHSRTPPPPSE